VLQVYYFFIPEFVQNRNPFEKRFLREIVIFYLGEMLALVFPLTFLAGF